MSAREKTSDFLIQTGISMKRVMLTEEQLPDQFKKALDALDELRGELNAGTDQVPLAAIAALEIELYSARDQHGNLIYRHQLN